MTRLALIGVLCLVGCDDPRLRPIDSGNDATDDTDDPWVEPDPEPRDGCLDGVLDEGWQTDFVGSDDFRPAPSGRVVFRSFDDGPDLRSISIDDWAGARLESDTVRLTDSALFDSTSFSSEGGQGFLTFGGGSRDDRIEARLWLDNRGFAEPMPFFPDVEVRWETTSRIYGPGIVAAGDVDGDGLDDLIFTDRRPDLDRGVVLGPIPAGVSRDDAELNQVGRFLSDWNDDGYADTFAEGADGTFGVYLGPLYGVTVDESPDLTWTVVGLGVPPFGNPPADLDGDGILELWAYDREEPAFHSVNYPGTGVFDTRMASTVRLTVDEGRLGAHRPLVGDFNGDGFGDVVYLSRRDEPFQPHRLQYIAGPLPAGESLTSMASSIDLPADELGGSLYHLGDTNSDGLDDFIVGGDVEAPRLFLGCPGW